MRTVDQFLDLVPEFLWNISSLNESVHPQVGVFDDEGVHPRVRVYDDEGAHPWVRVPHVSATLCIRV